MLTVAYLANQFPAAVEPYVGEEIQELRRRGVQVIAGSVLRPDGGPSAPSTADLEPEILCLQPFRLLILLRALALAVRRWAKRICRAWWHECSCEGKESPKRRLKALLHTWLGAYYAVLLEGRGVKHVHVHHGYFGSWIGMVAARLLGVSFSMTLHGSDLLLNRRLSRHEAEETVKVLRNHFRVQPAVHSGTFSGQSKPARSWFRGWGSMCRNARNPLPGCLALYAPHTFTLLGCGTAARGEGSRISGSRPVPGCGITWARL